MFLIRTTSDHKTETLPCNLTMVKMLRKCPFTVVSLTKRFAAISLLLLPRASNVQHVHLAVGQHFATGPVPSLAASKPASYNRPISRSMIRNSSCWNSFFKCPLRPARKSREAAEFWLMTR